MAGGRSLDNYSQGDAHANQQNWEVQQRQLDPWNKKDRVPEIPIFATRKRGAIDFIKRRANLYASDQRRDENVITLIRDFNKTLDLMQGDDISHARSLLPDQDLIEDFEKQVTHIMNKFAQCYQRILEYGGSRSTYKQTFAEFKGFHGALKEMYNDLEKVGKLWKDIDAKQASILSDQSIHRALSYLPQSQREYILTQVKIAKDEFKEYVREIIQSDYTDIFTYKKRKESLSELDKLCSTLTEIHDDLNKVKDMWANLDEIKSLCVLFSVNDGNTIKEDIGKVCNTINQTYHIALDGYGRVNHKYIEERRKAWRRLQNAIGWLEGTVKFIRDERRFNFMSAIGQRIGSCQQQFEGSWSQLEGKLPSSNDNSNRNTNWQKFKDKFDQDIMAVAITQSNIATEQGKIELQYLTSYYEQAVRLEQKVLAVKIAILRDSNPRAYQTLSRSIMQTDKIMNETLDALDKSKFPEQYKQNRRHEYIVLIDNVYELIEKAVEAAMPKSLEESSNTVNQESSNTVNQIYEDWSKITSLVNQHKEIYGDMGGIEIIAKYRSRKNKKL